MDSESLSLDYIISPFYDKIVGYLAGFVSLKLDATHGFIILKNKGYLSFPPRDVVAVYQYIVGTTL